ncbi:hypothetical protein EDEG_03688 [Edhazardia aedis USNM 41457]|uniref:Uncharacterized protein n=1 Tax=Edhazardia aedis (strain USNM 41457) TaxID=1003232 RepID=J8ZQ56_EDHAE|nr:hypothetical protein EDEG_03688 [Edhazardia aedis USNM 41457]|eukprot:EJW01828.1 hypothetical protein EDEG_03688 [Edhazardia aedis USNM 41457]
MFLSELSIAINFCKQKANSILCSKKIITFGYEHSFPFIRTFKFVQFIKFRKFFISLYDSLPSLKHSQFTCSQKSQNKHRQPLLSQNKPPQEHSSISLYRNMHIYGFYNHQLI